MTDFQIRLRRRGIPTAEIVADLQRVSREVGRQSITKIEYDERGVFGATTVLRKLGGWNKALAAAGLSVVHRQDIGNEELFENLASVWTKLGRQPFGRDMSDRVSGEGFSLGTYEKRFGSWNNALVAFSEYISSGNEPSNEHFSGTTHQRQANGNSRRTRREINWRLRAVVLIKHGCICQMCGDSPIKNPDAVLHVDHILAWANGGETVEENLQTLCAKCNIGKSDVLIPPRNGEVAARLG
jgi:5-methylcytosine-specific restriction endonuclease McrA